MKSWYLSWNPPNKAARPWGPWGRGLSGCPGSRLGGEEGLPKANPSSPAAMPGGRSPGPAGVCRLGWYCRPRSQQDCNIGRKEEEESEERGLVCPTLVAQVQPACIRGSSCEMC